MANNSKADVLIEERVIQLCLEYKKGITYEMIQNELPHLKSEEIKDLINKLLSKNKIDLLKQSSGKLIFKLKDVTCVQNIKGADPEEQVIFQLIQESGNQGIWVQDIRNKVNLVLNVVTKVLRKLESKKLIKSFNSVSAPKRKLYMLYDLQPDSSLTGGAWYSDQQFDSEFVDVISQQCKVFLSKCAKSAQALTGGPLAVKVASYVKASNVLDYIVNLNITKVSLTVKEVETILDTLVYDGIVEKSVGGDGVKIYREIVPFVQTSAFMEIPCGVCPLINECGNVGEITPMKCRYMKEWLDW